MGIESTWVELACCLMVIVGHSMQQLPTTRKKSNFIQDDPRGLNVVVMTSLQNNEPKNKCIVGKNDYIGFRHARMTIGHKLYMLEVGFWECSGKDNLPQPYLEKLCKTLNFTYLKLSNINM